MDEMDWVDLPADDYVAVLGYETENTKTLDALIRDYTDIPKDQVSTLPCRIKKLNKVVLFVRSWLEDRLECKDKKKHLVWICEIAEKKRNYLTALSHIYENNLHLEEAQRAYHIDDRLLQDRSKVPVILNHRRFFSLKMREYWGDFWVETLDPCHRRVTPFLDQWRSLKKQNFLLPHFFLWLETQHIPKYVPRVKYLKAEELEKCRLVVKEGLFWQRDDSEWVFAHFYESSRRYLFAIDLRGEIYAAGEEEGISHSSFTSGKPVLGSGLFRIDQGRLVSVALESGHYMPSIEIGYQILKVFEEKGVHFSNPLEIIFFYDRNKYKADVVLSPFPSLKQFQETLESAYSSKKTSCHELSKV